MREKMKRIGIITHYHKSTNSGGNLQAYALCEILLAQGCNVEQVSYLGKQISKSTFKRVFSGGLTSFFQKCVRYGKKLLCFPFVRAESKKLNLYSRRQSAFAHFNGNIIPHSDKVYRDTDIADCLTNYDCFITGSDQVWNVDGYDSVYFLDFVPSDKIKMSYAASIARDGLTDEQKEIFRKSLADYKAVSVREKSAEKLLEGLSPVGVQTVLDPTLLLAKEDWDKVCADRVIEDAYVFCYFLGDNRKERQIAKKFAGEKGLKLVALPHTAGIKLKDRKFGDERLYDVSPEQFLSLIKHAAYVFTDSFHAVVFSNIYQKQYFVFNRSKRGEMSSRIVDVTGLFDQQDRFCAGKEREKLSYITSLADIDYTKEKPIFEQRKKESIEFLKKNLEA